MAFFGTAAASPLLPTPVLPLHRSAPLGPVFVRLWRGQWILRTGRQQTVLRGWPVGTLIVAKGLLNYSTFMFVPTSIVGSGQSVIGHGETADRRRAAEKFGTKTSASLRASRLRSRSPT